jgi:site-specific recombinase XerD
MDNSPKKKLLDQMRDVLRLKHYARKTEESYLYWARRYILFHNKRHPREMRQAEITAFLTHLAVEEHVAASTQNQAYSAILFLYREVLQQPLDFPLDAVRARKPQRLPTVLSQEEVRQLLDQMSGTERLIAQLLYGTGLRVSEVVQRGWRHS